jgi:hypothetical protein
MAKEDRNEEVLKIGKQVLREHDLEFTVAYKGEVYYLKYPAPFEKGIIEARIAERLGGYPRSSYPLEHLALVEATAYVDELVNREKSPSHFKSAWTCYDETLIQKLYEGYLHFRNDLQEKIRRDGAETSSPGSGT